MYSQTEALAEATHASSMLLQKTTSTCSSTDFSSEKTSKTTRAAAGVESEALWLRNNQLTGIKRSQRTSGHSQTPDEEDRK